ncbi:MAG TPA: hypothetical protein VF176_04985, partial [Solirubrobacterales bacterium]
EVKGSAESSSTVKLYATANCSGAPLNSGSAAQFASPGITVSVSDNTTTSLRATATDAAGNASGCSGPFDYIEDSLAPEPEPEPTPPVEPSPAEPSPVPLSDLTFGLAPSASNIVSKASIAVNVAPVMGGSARLRLQCVGDSVCRGTITLIVWIKARKPARQSTLRHVGRQAHGVLIGKRPYAIAAGRTRLIQVRLTRRGKALLRRSGRRGLRARLRGPGLQNTTVRLQPRGRRPRS